MGSLATVIGVLLTAFSLYRSADDKTTPEGPSTESTHAVNSLEVRVYIPSDLYEATLLIDGQEPALLKKTLSFILLELKAGTYTFTLKGARTCETRAVVSLQSTSIFPCI